MIKGVADLYIHVQAHKTYFAAFRSPTACDDVRVPSEHVTTCYVT